MRIEIIVSGARIEVKENFGGVVQQSEHYLGIKYDPGMLSSSVARTAPFALASLLK